MSDIERAREIIKAAPRGPYKVLGYIELAQINTQPGLLRTGTGTDRWVRVGYSEPIQNQLTERETTIALVHPDAARYLCGSSDPRYGWAAVLALVDDIRSPAEPAPVIECVEPTGDLMERVIERAAQIIAARVLK